MSPVRDGLNSLIYHQNFQCQDECFQDMTTTLHHLILNSANNFGDKPAAIIPAADADHADLIISYRSLQNKIEECRRKFAQYGIKPHDVISSVLVNNLEFVVSFLATTNAKGTESNQNSIL